LNVKLIFKYITVGVLVSCILNSGEGYADNLCKDFLIGELSVEKVISSLGNSISVGDKAFPLNRDIDIRFTDAEEKGYFPEVMGKTFKMTFQRISTQSKRLRQFMLKLKIKARPEPTTQIEVGAIIVYYRDGSSKAIYFTSNELHTISGESATAAANKSGIFESHEEIVGVVDIHTHPDLGLDTNIFFSDGDISKYLSLKNQLVTAIGGEIRYTAMVLPNCSECNDVVGVMEF
jgi:hypothetical protein